MEWVETTARSVEEAKDLLLDRLGVDDDEAEFEVLEEPKVGIFGRPRGEARVRARVKPKAPRAKNDRRRSRGGRKGRPDGEGGQQDRQRSAEPATTAQSDQPPAGGTAPEESTAGDGAPPRGGRARSGPRPEERGHGDREPQEAADPELIASTVQRFLAGVVDGFGLEATTDATVVEGEVHAVVRGPGLGRLIGPRGAVVDALQELSRTASQKEAKGRSVPKIRVDVGSYRADRRAELESFTRKVAEEVRDTGETRVFEPMGSVDRKTVHDAAAEVDGVETRSQGEDPDRRVVIQKA